MVFPHSDTLLPTRPDNGRLSRYQRNLCAKNGVLLAKSASAFHGKCDTSNNGPGTATSIAFTSVLKNNGNGECNLSRATHICDGEDQQYDCPDKWSPFAGCGRDNVRLCGTMYIHNAGGSPATHFNANNIKEFYSQGLGGFRPVCDYQYGVRPSGSREQYKRTDAGTDYRHAAGRYILGSADRDGNQGPAAQPKNARFALAFDRGTAIAAQKGRHAEALTPAQPAVGGERP